MAPATHITFDTLNFVERLKKAGMPEKQAKAVLDAQKEAFVEASGTVLATKKDIRHIERRIDKVEMEIKYLKWMNGFVITGVGALIFKAFF